MRSIHPIAEAGLAATPDAASRSGCWRLEGDAALSLRPRAASELRVARGTVWLTLDRRASGAGSGAGDIVLHAGERALLPAGRHAVLQAMCRSQPVWFDWREVPVAGGHGPLVRAARVALAAGAAWLGATRPRRGV